MTRNALPNLSPPQAITAAHDLAGFDCSNQILNDWLKLRALQNESRFSRTYVVCEGNRVAAYVCISAGAVDRAAAPGKLRRNAPDSIPVSIIGRLAVDKRYAGRGLGADMLAEALRRIAAASQTIGIAAASQTIGIAAVIVQAKDENAKKFYMACAEFVEFPAESRTLFLAMETVVGAVEINQNLNL